MLKTKPDFVIASSNNYTGFISTNLKHVIYSYTRRNVEDCVDFIKENWPESTMTSDNIFDNIKDKRPYKESDLIYTNKIKTRLKQLEESENKKIIMSNKDLTR